MRVFESVWSSKMIYECISKHKNVYEPIWWYMKVYDSIWIKMVRNEFLWKGIKLCDGIGVYMIVYGWINAHMDVYESI